MNDQFISVGEHCYIEIKNNVITICNCNDRESFNDIDSAKKAQKNWIYENLDGLSEDEIIKKHGWKFMQEEYVWHKRAKAILAKLELINK